MKCLDVAVEDHAANPVHIAAARRIAVRFSRKWPRLADELESAAYVALVEASRTYDPDRGVRFASHMGNRVTGAMLDLIRDWIPKGYRRNTECAPRIETIEGVTKDDLISEDGPVGWELEYQDSLRYLTRGLSRNEREVIHRLYGHADQITKARTGKHLGMCESNVSIIHSGAIEELRRVYNQRGNNHVSCDECDEYDPSGSGE